MRSGPPSSPVEGASVEPLRGAGHVEALAAVHGEAFSRPWGAGEFATLLARPTTRAHGLFRGRALMGFAMSQLVGDEAEVLTVAVALEIRGRGHARPLFARHLEDLAAEGARAVHLEVEVGNASALALYRGAGFREVGRRPDYYAKAGEAPAEAIRMTLDGLGEGSAAMSRSGGRAQDVRQPGI